MDGTARKSIGEAERVRAVHHHWRSANFDEYRSLHTPPHLPQMRPRFAGRILHFGDGVFSPHCACPRYQQRATGSDVAASAQS